MKTVKILDCTLRDGGYINDWKFGNGNICKIIGYLQDAGIDIIECGFIRDEKYDKDVSVFSSVEQMKELIGVKSEGIMYVAMIALGDIDIDRISDRDEGGIDGIRLTFHRTQWEEARQSSLKLIEKGYKVFMQPVGTTVYTDDELIALVNMVNSVHPYAFYLVDTLGILHRRELRHLFRLVDENLAKNICLGFHSHNNLQLSFANAQDFIELGESRETIVDASIFGMGRGVGNLATELIAEYINSNIKNRYSIFPLLSAADECIMPIYSEVGWGYGLPYFLSAAMKCHPSYAAYLLKKETLNMESISQILSKIPCDKRDMFFAEEIDALYNEYQECRVDDSNAVDRLTGRFRSKDVLLIAPGPSIEIHRSKIEEFIKNNSPEIISVNFKPREFNVGAVFVSNRKRAELLKNESGTELIVTSNISTKELTGSEVVNYSSYIGEGRASDNAGAMVIRLLKKCGVGHIYLAGFDGFDANSAENFSVNSMRKPMSNEEARGKNTDISNQLAKALQGLNYDFITPTRYTLK